MDEERRYTAKVDRSRLGVRTGPTHIEVEMVELPASLLDNERAEREKLREALGEIARVTGTSTEAHHLARAALSTPQEEE